MEEFLIILAWILAIPSTLYVLWCLIVIGLLYILKAAAAFHLSPALFLRDAKLTIEPNGMITFIMFAVSWAWIFSR